jgi:plastocyanin
MSRIDQHRQMNSSRSQAGRELTFSRLSLRVRKLSSFILAAAAVTVFSAMSGAAQGAQPAEPGSGSIHVVTMKQMGFDPAQMNVQPGDTVEWKNDDMFAHTVTANDGSFDSGLIQPGHSWQKTFTSAETLAYHCRPHPNMKATLVVQPATQGAHAKTAASASESGATLKWSPPRTPEEFHPILVNFTAALLPLALLSDILGLLSPPIVPSRGMVDGAVCIFDHSTDRRCWMVVEAVSRS